MPHHLTSSKTYLIHKFRKQLFIIARNVKTRVKCDADTFWVISEEIPHCSWINTHNLFKHHSVVHTNKPYNLTNNTLHVISVAGKLELQVDPHNLILQKPVTSTADVSCRVLFHVCWIHWSRVDLPAALSHKQKGLHGSWGLLQTTNGSIVLTASETRTVSHLGLHTLIPLSPLSFRSKGVCALNPLQKVFTWCYIHNLNDS